jgi:hypothetical protein
MNVEKLTARINAKVQDIVGVLGRQTLQARQMLRKLLTDKIDLEPVGSGRDRGYKFRGTLAIDRLIGGDTIGTHLTVVAPTGFEPVYESGHVFAKWSTCLHDSSDPEDSRDPNTCSDHSSRFGGTRSLCMPHFDPRHKNLRPQSAPALLWVGTLEE